MSTTRATGNHVPDAHLAALAIEWGLELVTADMDFARYARSAGETPSTREAERMNQ